MEPPRDQLKPPTTLESEWERILHASGVHLESEGIPPNIVATPNELRPLARGDVRWWRPGWADGWRFVGWRWILLAPLIFVLVALLALFRGLPLPALAISAQLLVAIAAVAVTLAAYVFRRATRARSEPFCIFCGYNLTGLPDHYNCPECGRPYSWRVIAEYRRDPQWFIDRYNALSRLPPADAPFEARRSARRRRRDGT